MTEVEEDRLPSEAVTIMTLVEKEVVEPRELLLRELVEVGSRVGVVEVII